MRAATCTLLIWVSISFAQWTEPERITPNWGPGWEQPWISNDGQRLYVTDRIDLFVSTRDSLGGWSPPLRLPEHVNEMLNVRSPCESPTGDTLYFTGWDWVDPNGWDVYYVVRADSGWGSVLNLGPPVNDINDQRWVGISRDGSMLLIGLSFDIYYHELQIDGNWGPRTNFSVGAPGRSDEHPCLSPDNSRLFFSRASQNSGDVWESINVDGVWQSPAPLPNPLINGTFTLETEPCLMNDGRTLIFRKGTLASNYLYMTVDTTILEIADGPSDGIETFHIAVYPNPFNSANTITLSIPSYDRDVEIVVINTLGQIVNRETVRAAGGMAHYVNDMSGFASGVYFVRAQAGEYAAAKKIVLLK